MVFNYVVQLRHEPGFRAHPIIWGVNSCFDLHVMAGRLAKAATELQMIANGFGTF
jgi:hypothetical protein